METNGGVVLHCVHRHTLSGLNSSWRSPITFGVVFHQLTLHTEILLTQEVSPVGWLVIQQSPRECITSDPKSPGRSKKNKKKNKWRAGREEGWYL